MKYWQSLFQLLFTPDKDFSLSLRLRNGSRFLETWQFDYLHVHRRLVGFYPLFAHKTLFLLLALSFSSRGGENRMTRGDKRADERIH